MKSKRASTTTGDSIVDTVLENAENKRSTTQKLIADHVFNPVPSLDGLFSVFEDLLSKAETVYEIDRDWTIRKTTRLFDQDYLKEDWVNFCTAYRTERDLILDISHKHFGPVSQFSELERILYRMLDTYYDVALIQFQLEWNKIHPLVVLSFSPDKTTGFILKGNFKYTE